MKREKRGRLKRLLYNFKNPAFFIGFIVAWTTLESPAIVGIVLYWITQNAKWLALFTSWVALTAAPLPVPVMPLSILVATSCALIRNKIRRKYGKEEHLFRSIKHFDRIYWFGLKATRRVAWKRNCFARRLMQEARRTAKSGRVWGEVVNVTNTGA